MLRHSAIRYTQVLINVSLYYNDTHSYIYVTEQVRTEMTNSHIHVLLWYRWNQVAIATDHTHTVLINYSPNHQVALRGQVILWIVRRGNMTSRPLPHSHPSCTHSPITHTPNSLTSTLTSSHSLAHITFTPSLPPFPSLPHLPRSSRTQHCPWVRWVGQSIQQAGSRGWAHYDIIITYWLLGTTPLHQRQG